MTQFSQITANIFSPLTPFVQNYSTIRFYSKKVLRTVDGGFCVLTVPRTLFLYIAASFINVTFDASNTTDDIPFSFTVFGCHCSFTGEYLKT